MADFLIIKENDDAVAINDTIKNDGAVLDLTGSTVTFSMRARGATTNKIDGAAATITSAPAGEVRYTFVAADVDTPGQYDYEWKIAVSGGNVVHTPSKCLLISGSLKP